MIQHQLLQSGKTLVTRDMPHTPATGRIEVTKVEHSVVHFDYRRVGEDQSRSLFLGKADCEFMIAKGYWTDAAEDDAKPIFTEVHSDSIEGDFHIAALGDFAERLWKKFDAQSVDAAILKALQSELSRRHRART